VPPAVAPPPGNPRFKGIDGLRAIAAVAVVMTHCAVYTNNVDGGVFDLVWLRVGQFALAIFFAISGFLLYRPFVAAQLDGKPHQRMGAYARRRVLRVVPAYWLALTVLAVVPGVPGLFDSDWWKQYLFLQVYSEHTAAEGLPQTWSLCVEVVLYVLLPVMVVAIGWVIGRVRRKAAPGLALAMIGAFALVGIGLVAWAVFGHIFWLHRFGPSYLWWFGAGMLLAVVSVRPPARMRRLVEAARAHPGACWWVALVPFALGVWLGPRGPLGGIDQQQFVWYLVAPLTAAALLAPAVFVADGGWPRRFLAKPWVMWLGLMSYGIFLWHIGVLWALKDLGVTEALTPDGLIPLFVLVFPISVACAAASYYWVERPFYALKDRRLRPRPRGKSRPARARA
jgi:peptidoglycan/LPS O-acetylase OafA/YrhL